MQNRYYFQERLRLVFTCSVATVLSLLLVCRVTASSFIAGADISALPVLESQGATYANNGTTGDALEILGDKGVDWVRLRLFVDPLGEDPVAVNDLAYTIALAQRAQAAGSQVLLDFHYSDTWTDPGKQFKPGAWNGLSFNQLEEQVYDYTRQTITAFEEANALPAMVQIGNEISNGMLWNDGRLWRPGISESQEFNNLASLVSAGIHGARDAVAPGNEPQIMMHHDKGSDWGTSSYYFDRLLPRLQANGTDIDVIGYSYYPKWHYNPFNGNGDIMDLQQTLNNTADAYGKPVMVVETGFASRGAQFEPDFEFPVSPPGQQQFLEEVVNAVQNVPDAMGWGVFWWYAEAVPVNGINVWEDGHYGLFDQNGNTLPALEVFAQLAAQSPQLAGDFDNDGDVDGKDFLAWQTQVGSQGMLSADTNGDLRVDAKDLAAWSDDFGQFPSPLLQEHAVPEPGGLVVLGLSILFVPNRQGLR